MMTINEDIELGTTRISPEAIETITKIAIMEIDGVSSINTSFFGRSKEATQGIKIKLGEKDVTIDVSINIKYGYSIPVIADQIQTKVKETIEGMVGLEVLEVNIFFSNIDFDK